MGLVGGIRVINLDAPVRCQEAAPAATRSTGPWTPQPQDQQRITPAETFWALYGALSHPPMLIASKSYTHRSD